MKYLVLILALILISSCSDNQVEEIAFRKVLEYQLVDLCKEDKKCIDAVKSQTKACMVKSDWKRYVDNQDNQQELKKFTDKFYACIVDEKGEPYFHSND